MCIGVQNLNKHVESKGFWRWCMGLRITEFIDFVHRPEFYLTRKKFRKLALFPSSGDGKETPTLSDSLGIANLVDLVSKVSAL
jgi:hypothetical protein